MHEIFTMMLAVYDRAALMLICLFFLIRLRLFRELLHKSAHTPKELLAVTAIFALFALFSTWSGVSDADATARREVEKIVRKNHEFLR